MRPARRSRETGFRGIISWNPKACGAGGSIKPGACASGTSRDEHSKPRSGRQQDGLANCRVEQCDLSAARCRGLSIFIDRVLGFAALHPRLYAIACFARSLNRDFHDVGRFKSWWTKYLLLSSLVRSLHLRLFSDPPLPQSRRCESPATGQPAPSPPQAPPTPKALRSRHRARQLFFGG